MRERPSNRLEKCRIAGPVGINCGAFQIDAMRIVASDGAGWDHVSVSFPGRCPTWEEMHKVKQLFFRPLEAVMQLHPPEHDYLNCHPYCLHLWRAQSDAEIARIRRQWGDEWIYGDLHSPGEIPLPPSELVGPKQTQPTDREIAMHEQRNDQETYDQF